MLCVWYWLIAEEISQNASVVKQMELKTTNVKNKKDLKEDQLLTGAELASYLGITTEEVSELRLLLMTIIQKVKFLI